LGRGGGGGGGGSKSNIKKGSESIMEGSFKKQKTLTTTVLHTIVDQLDYPDLQNLKTHVIQNIRNIEQQEEEAAFFEHLATLAIKYPNLASIIQTVQKRNGRVEFQVDEQVYVSKSLRMHFIQLNGKYGYIYDKKAGTISAYELENYRRAFLLGRVKGKLTNDAPKDETLLQFMSIWSSEYKYIGKLAKAKLGKKYSKFSTLYDEIETGTEKFWYVVIPSNSERLELLENLGTYLLCKGRDVLMMNRYKLINFRNLTDDYTLSDKTVILLNEADVSDEIRQSGATIIEVVSVKGNVTNGYVFRTFE
jgi:hypothetical protein